MDDIPNLKPQIAQIAQISQITRKRPHGAPVSSLISPDEFCGGHREVPWLQSSVKTVQSVVYFGLAPVLLHRFRGSCDP